MAQANRKPKVAAKVATKEEPMLKEVFPVAKEEKPVAKAEKSAKVKKPSATVVDIKNGADITPTETPEKVHEGEITKDLGCFPVTTEDEHKAQVAAQLVSVQTDISLFEIDELINRIYTTRLNLQREVAVLAAKCVLRTIKFGDIHVARKFLQALGAAPKGASKTIFRANDLKAWFISKGCPYKWDDTVLTDYTTGKKIEAKGLMVDVDKLKSLQKAYKAKPQSIETTLVEEPFFVFKPEPEFQGFDLLSQLKTLVKRAKSERIKHANDPRLKLEGLDQIDQLLTQIARSPNPEPKRDNKDTDTSAPTEGEGVHPVQ